MSDAAPGATRAVTEIALELMKVDSTTGREGEVVDSMARLLEARGWLLTRIPVSPGRDCLLARAKTDIGVTLCTHLDTVPPYIAPRLDGDRLSGRGACDAKGIAAAMVEAAEVLRGRGVSVALLFVVGEETNHDGAAAANEWIAANLPARPRILINGEPTESTLALGTKGSLRVIVRTQGRAAHSAYPELGVSAIARLVDILHELDGIDLPSDPVLGAMTINIGSITGGLADNVIAPEAEARLMARLVTPVDDAWTLLQRWIGDRAVTERGISVPPIHLTPVEGFPTSVVAFATDLPVLTNWGNPSLFGPGSVHVAHTDEEHVSVSELGRAVGTYVRLAEARLGALPEARVV